MTKDTRSKIFNRVGRFTIIPRSLLRWGPDIGPAPIYLWAYLFDKENHTTGQLFPSYITIEAETGLDDRAIAKSIRSLERIGALRRKKTFMEPTQYFLLAPPSPTPQNACREEEAPGADKKGVGSKKSLKSPTPQNACSAYPPKRVHIKNKSLKNIKTAAKTAAGSPHKHFKHGPPQLPLDSEEGAQVVAEAEAISRLRGALEKITLLSARDNGSLGRLQNAAERLYHDKGADPVQLSLFKRWWEGDWRGKGGKHPTPNQVVELFSLAMAESGQGSEGKGQVMGDL